MANSGSSLETQTWYEPYQAREYRLFMKTDRFRSFLMNECRVQCLFVSGVDESSTADLKAVDGALVACDVCDEWGVLVCISWCLVSMCLFSGIVSSKI